jgi:small subunit ribosomal protein S1
MSDSETPRPDAPTPAPAQPAAEGQPPAPAPEPERPAGTRGRLQSLDRDIESELAEALGDFSADEVLGQQPAGRRPPAPAAGAAPGRLKGKVLRVHGADVFVDVPGSRGQGVLPLAQFPEGPPAPGTEVEVHIEGYDRANGLTLLSRRGAAVEADWSSVAPGMIVEARVTETNKGGLSVDVNGIRGFMPISQIDLYRVERPEDYVNQRLLCLVTEVNPEERNLVVSRRALLEKEREEKREKMWQTLAEGQQYEGVVRSVQPFGAFVDLGGVDGLVHVSEMSWQRVQNPADVVQPGQRVMVVVLKVDRDKRKVGLGMKQLAPSPWDGVAEKYPEGAVVTGKVTRLAEFGAFVELEPGIEGLIHISELAPQRVWRVSDIVQPGQEVKVLVLRVDPAQRRISLSLKAAQPKEPEPKEEEEEAAEEAPAKPPRTRTTPLRGGIGENRE